MIDDEVMLCVANGEESALSRLYDKHSRAIYSLAHRIVGDSGAAEEILQDVFLQLWRKSYQFNPSLGSLGGWLLTITRHRAISHLRKKNNRLYVESLDDAFESLSRATVPAELRQEDNARELVSIAMRALPALQRDAITMAYFEGMTCEEIAVHTKTPLGTTKSRIRAALQAMRKCLRDDGHFTVGREARKGFSLADILITYQLALRPWRQRDAAQETTSLRALSQVAAGSPHELIDAFLQIPMQICCAGTAGLSLLETNASGEPVFRWTNLSGELKKYVGGTTPRNFSPCGVTLDRGSPQLFAHPGRYFQYFNEVQYPIVEGLVVPFYAGDEIQGTVWIVSHEEVVRFDAEDARIMTTLAEFTGAALHAIRSQGAGLSA